MKVINKIWVLVAIFLLLIPFRLPISILIIKSLTFIVVELGGDVVSTNMLAANFIITKFIYNLLLSISFVYKREYIGYRSNSTSPYRTDYKDVDQFWWTILSSILLGCYIIYDCVISYDLALLILK